MRPAAFRACQTPFQILPFFRAFQVPAASVSPRGLVRVQLPATVSGSSEARASHVPDTAPLPTLALHVPCQVLDGGASHKAAHTLSRAGRSIFPSYLAVYVGAPDFSC